MNDPMLLEGLHIPLTTPFHPDGRLNLPKLASNAVRYSKSPAAGLIVLGPSGEPTLLSDDETREVLSTVAEAASPEKVLIAGISRDSVRATLALADFAASLDYDAILVGVPSILASATPVETGKERTQPATHPRELLTYFQTLADRSPLPIILLTVTGRSVLTGLIVELAAHPNIIGAVDAAATPLEVEAILQSTAGIRHNVSVTSVFAAVTTRMKNAATKTHASAALISASSLAGTATAVADPPPLAAPSRTRTRVVGFQILAAAAPRMLDGLRAGAAGIAPPFAACAPQACFEIFAAWKDEDQTLAEEKQLRLREAARLTEDSSGIGPGSLKFACDLNGYFGGQPRLPHLPPTGAKRTELEQHMKPLRN